MRVHILDDWFDTLRGLPCFSLLGGHEVTIWTDHVQDTDTLAARLAHADALALFRERTALRADLIARLPNLRLISQRSVYPHIDLPACTRHGVLLCSSMHADTPSIAASELTFALILASARQIPQQMAALQAGRWQLAPGQTLAGRTLGLYGYGRIARQVAHYAKAFGMQVQWWASSDGRARALADGAPLAPSRDAFFATSDVVSVHVRLNGATRAIITRADLLAMKPSATFVNTSRAGIVEDGALEAALAAGRPRRLALDVFGREPMMAPVDPLVLHPDVVATPHIGYVTEDEFNAQFTDIFEQINAFAKGSPINAINPEAIANRRAGA
jgi:D-3-phosphoglycerate dehydrogenase